MPGLAEAIQGPMLIGFLFNVLLYGTMIAQVYVYYTTYRSDKLWMKLFVLLILVADTVNTIFDFVYLYRALIIHFGDLAFLAKADWYFATDPAITGIIAILVQIFFAWRLGALTKSWPLVAVVCLGSLLGGAGAIATAYEVGRTPNFVDFRNFKSVVIIWLASSAITDLIITTFLVWFFKPKKVDLEDLILYWTALYDTGLITALVATLDLIFFLAFPTGLHLLFNFPLCKLYSNSLMSSLNSRHGWKFGSAHGGSTNHEVSTANLDIMLTTSAPTSPLNPNFAVRSIRNSYVNFNGDDSGLFKVHSETSSVTSPPDVMHSEKIIRPASDVDESHKVQDVIHSKQELPGFPKQRGVNSVPSADMETTKRGISRQQDSEDGEAEEIVQPHT